MVRVKECVRFKCIPRQFLILWEVLHGAAAMQKTEATITGASYEKYKKGSYHDRGYAWDVRIQGIPHPLQYVCEIRCALVNIDPRFRVVYGDANHTDHVHIEYRHDQVRKKK